jgi:hypothetical protein
MSTLPAMRGRTVSRLFSRCIWRLRCHRSMPVDRWLCALRLSAEFAFVKSLQPGQGADGPKGFHVYVLCRQDHIFLDTGSLRSAVRCVDCTLQFRLLVLSIN